MHVKDPVVHASTVDYGYSKITQHALKVSESSESWSWTLYERTLTKILNDCSEDHKIQYFYWTLVYISKL